MAEREQEYWWHVGRLKIIEQYLALAGKSTSAITQQKILNVGCGTGGTLPSLEKFGSVSNVDVSDDAIEFMKKRGYTVKKVDGVKLPFKKDTFSLVAAFDVLEHIDNDVEALKEWARVLEPGGKIVLTVPAYKWLWSDHDVSLHHFRRHTKRSIQKKAEAAGLTPVKVSYAIVFSLPLVSGFRMLNRLLRRKIDSETSYVDIPQWTNALFGKFLSSEAIGHRYFSYPLGTSVIAILERK